MDGKDVAAIELRGVSKRYAEVAAVQGFSVEIRRGEFFSLLGPSGCGKTTTLRMIAGLESPSEGSIFLEGKDVTGTPSYRRNVNTVFQDYALFPHMNVKKNIFFPLKMKKMSRLEADPKIRRVLRLVNMEGFEHRMPQQLSGGQRQRIALARSLVNEPAALLLDEPLGALDFKLRIAMQKVLKDIQRDVGITFIYVTHDQTEAMTMSDRIAVMKDGVVHQVGCPDEIYNGPATAFVASFIGDMNFLAGGMKTREGGGGTVEVAGRTVRTHRAMGLIAPGDEALVCVRSEKVLVSRRRSKSGARPENHFEGAIRRIVFRGSEYEVTCGVDGAELRAVVSATVWDSALREGDRVEVGFQSSDVIVFHGSEERNVIRYEAAS
jgi:spermidine/putrescine transport system ATP-binding protein